MLFTVLGLKLTRTITGVYRYFQIILDEIVGLAVEFRHEMVIESLVQAP